MNRKIAFKFLCVVSTTSLAVISCSNNHSSDGISGKPAPDIIDRVFISTSQQSEYDITDSLKNLAKEDFGLLELFTRGDTLNIVSTSTFLYYPFGKFRNINAFAMTYKDFKTTVEHEPTDSSVTLYRMSSGSSFVKFFRDTENNALEIVSGKIDNSTSLVNGIKIGIDKTTFLKNFFNEVPGEEIVKVNVIKLLSGLEGISHIYSFNQGILISFYFETDYSFNKK